MLSKTADTSLSRSHHGHKMFFLCFSLVLSVAVIDCSASQSPENINSCSLFTQKDAERALGNATDSGVDRNSMMPAGRSCRYTFKKNGNIYGIKIIIASDSLIKEEGLFESASDNFQRQKQARKNHDYASKLLSQVPNLGDDAFWSGSKLWVLKGSTLLIIDSDAYLEGTFKDRDEADKARKELDLRISLDAARVMLNKLP